MPPRFLAILSPKTPGRVIASFHPSRMPSITRGNYRRELVSTALFPAAMAIVEGGVISVIVKKAFEGSVPSTRLNYAVALLGAAPEFANLTSFVWARLAHARRKVGLIAAIQAALLALVLIMAFLPRSPAGLVAMMALVVGARVCITGILTLRATIWRANYPRSDRARITGKLSAIQSIVVAAVGLLLGLTMEKSDDAYRYAVPIAVTCGLLGTLAYARIRMRGHRRLLRAEMEIDREGRPSLSPLAMIRLLDKDRDFARFMLWMFVLGIGNLMLTAPLVITLREQFHQDYLGGILITTTIPLLTLPFFVSMWARLMDRRHIVGFRAVHSWAFVASQATVLTGAATGTLWLMYIGAVFQGVGLAGGALAWNLGHLDFAPPERAAQYMGVHVTLTGIRGLIAPFVTVSVYELLRRTHPGSEIFVFALSVVVCIAGAIGFGSMSRRMGDAAMRPHTLG